MKNAGSHLSKHSRQYYRSVVIAYLTTNPLVSVRIVPVRISNGWFILVSLSKELISIRRQRSSRLSPAHGRREIKMAHAEVGRSLPVPNVQALAQTCSDSDEQIHERYIRVEEAAEEVISGRDISAIPVIDLSKLLDPQSSKEECAKLGSACSQWGFFQVCNKVWNFVFPVNMEVKLSC
jgi:hypothetical protein